MPEPADLPADLAYDMAFEITGKLTAMEIVLQPLSVLQMVALVQLSLRHPYVPADIRATAERFLAGAREYFADCPAVLEVVRAGDDPAADVPPLAWRPPS